MGSSSLTKDWTRASCIGSTEPKPLDHQGSPINKQCFIPKEEVAPILILKDGFPFFLFLVKEFVLQSLLYSLCPWNFPGKNTRVGIPFSRGSFDLGIQPRSSALQADSLPSESPGKPRYTWKTKTLNSLAFSPLFSPVSSSSQRYIYQDS